jgi:hypothetical protein
LVIQKAGRSTSEMIPAELVTPYYEHIIKNKNYYKAIGASDLISKAESRLAGIDTGAIASNFVNDFGLNTNLVDTGSILNMPSPQNYSGITIDETNTEIPNVVSAESMQKAYKSSGSKRPFRDWLYSEDGKGIAVIASAKPAMIKVEDKGRDQGGMPEKLVKPNAETGLKENEKKGVLVLASDQFVEPGSEDRAWVLFNDAQENEVVAVVNTKNNNLVWCVVKGKNKNGGAAVGVSKFVADKLGIFDEKTVVRVKYATAK